MLIHFFIALPFRHLSFFRYPSSGMIISCVRSVEVYFTAQDSQPNDHPIIKSSMPLFSLFHLLFLIIYAIVFIVSLIIELFLAKQ